MKLPNAATLALVRWIEDGCKLSDGEPDSVRDGIREIVSGPDDAGAAMALRRATTVAALHDVAVRGSCGLAVALIESTVADGIDWKYVIEKFRHPAELN